MGYRELLRTQHAFRRLWAGALVSQCGDWLQFVALLQLFPTRGRAVEALAGVFIVRALPWVVWAPVAGVVADRLPRGQVMIASDLLRAVTVLGYLLVDGPGDLPLVYALMFAQESLSAFFEPARAAVLPQIVEPRALLAANSLSGATWSATLALGSLLGGVISAALGPRAAFLADAASFVLSALLLASVRFPPPPARDAGAPRDRFGLAAVREGARWLRAHGAQASAAAVKTLWGLSSGIVFLFSVYAAEVFAVGGRDAATNTGLLYAGRGVGALLGPLVARRFLGETADALRRGIQIAFPLAAAAMAAFAFVPSAQGGAALLVLAHAGGSTCWVNSTQLLQLSVPNALQGRVFAVELAGLTVAMALSNAFAGAVLGRELLGLRATTLAMAGMAITSALVWALAMRRHAPALDAAAASPPQRLPP